MTETNQLTEIGEIVTWESPEEVDFAKMKEQALAAGLDADKLLRDMLPRNAFKRACAKLSENRVIREVSDKDGVLTFQFTREWMDGVEYQYSTEAFVRLNKETGNCTSDDAELADLATRLVNEQLGKRGAADVTRLVQALFRQNGDLIPIRRQGGAYFVPKRQSEFADNVARFLDAISGTMRRWEVMGGSKASESAAQSVRDEMNRLIKDFRESCKDIDSDSSSAVTARRARRHRVLKAKLDAYGDLLSAYSDECRNNLSEAKAELERKIMGEDASEAPAPDVDAAQDLLAASGQEATPEAAEEYLDDLENEDAAPRRKTIRELLQQS